MYVKIELEQSCFNSFFRGYEMEIYLSFVIFVIIANVIQSLIKRAKRAAKEKLRDEQVIQEIKKQKDDDDPFADYEDPWEEFDKKEGKY